ncbi:MAG TPA: efflux RND transporter periplasmic adaptor subunit [Pyrinomonadaceae bacterium]|nr:efflux RND transporter periplasmic adaptor subunit [Pyrinomonadaceae bacterium]
MKVKAMLNVAALVSLSLLTACGAGETKEKTEKPVKVKAVELRSSSTSVRYSASIRPNSQVEISFKVGGYVDAIAQISDASGQHRYVQAGDVVFKGTVLARVRQSDYVAQVNQANAQVSEARSGLATNNAQLAEARTAVETARAQVADSEAAFERATRDFDRAKTLYATQSMIKPDFDAAKAQYDATAARLKASKGQLEQAQAKVATAASQIGAAEARIKSAQAQTAQAVIPLQDTQLRAPISGVLIERKVELGALVAGGTPGFVLADLNTVKAVFGVPDLALQSMRLGATLNLTTDGVPGTEFSGHISRISPSADQSSRVFEVEVTIPNPQGLLKPGMIASLAVNEGGAVPTEVPVVPLTAVTRSKENPNAYVVFVVEEQNGQQVARRRQVELGETFGNAIAVTSGMKAGELVVTTGATHITDGEAVQVVP